jgi:hypothetical protein
MLAIRAIAEGGQGADEDPEPTGDEDPEENTDEEPDKDDPAPTGDRRRAKDSRKMQAADADTVRRAKIIAPRMAARVGDSRCAVMRYALRSAMRDKALAPAINNVLRGSTLDSADCLTLDAAFITASELAKQANNARTADGLTRATVKDFGKTVSPADINKANREFHQKGGK